MQEKHRDEVGLLLTRYRALSSDDQRHFLGSIAGDRNEQFIPYGIFSTHKLSSLEAIVKYLREDRGLKLFRIAALLGRSQKTIWTTYSIASKKMPEPFGSIRDDLLLSVSLLRSRTLSILEHVVMFAKSKGFTNHEIGVMLRLDDRTIWSVVHRAKKKGGAL